MATASIHMMPGYAPVRLSARTADGVTFLTLSEGSATVTISDRDAAALAALMRRAADAVEEAAGIGDHDLSACETPDSLGPDDAAYRRDMRDAGLGELVR